MGEVLYWDSLRGFFLSVSTSVLPSVRELRRTYAQGQYLSTALRLSAG